MKNVFLLCWLYWNIGLIECKYTINSLKETLQKLYDCWLTVYIKSKQTITESLPEIKYLWPKLKNAIGFFFFIFQCKTSIDVFIEHNTMYTHIDRNTLWFFMEKVDTLERIVNQQLYIYLEGYLYVRIKKGYKSKVEAFLIYT